MFLCSADKPIKTTLSRQSFFEPQKQGERSPRFSVCNFHIYFDEIYFDVQISIDMQSEGLYTNNSLNIKPSCFEVTGINDNYTELNHFLVKVFNEILRIEEASLRKDQFKNLSVREMHVIEAICTANEKGTSNRATDIANALRISAGTLTTTVTLLEKKGYLRRRQDEQDKRIIRLYATERGTSANQAHQSFHHEMVMNVMNTLDIEEIEVLIKGLKSLEMFFNSNK